MEKNMTGKICGTGSWAPDRVWDNNDLAKMVETSDQWIRERTGVILYGGRIAGNWKRPARPDDSCVETSFFETDTAVDRDILEEAVNRYRAFYRAV